MRREPTIRAALAVALTGTALACAFDAAAAVGSATARRCAPPRGPGDGVIHSTELRVTSITCAAGRKVALACRRFTYGHVGICLAVGYGWGCTSTRGPGAESAEHCWAGPQSVSILWTD